MSETFDPNDNPRALVRPPRLFGAALVLGLVLEWFWPSPLGVPEWTRWASLLPIVGGLAFGVWAFTLFKKRGTNVPPVMPVIVFVTDGPYRWSRNPMYLGLTLIFSGLVVAFDSWWLLGALLAALLVLRFGVIAREESYMTRRFGDEYLFYKARVRRWF